MELNKYLDVNPEVAAAIAAGKPVVALESTIISHGMPYPQNVETRNITMELNKYLDVNPEVAAAIAAGKPVVALESTIISHGMPYPQNVETALNVERIIRENGAVPATIAIIGGRLKAGLTAEEIEYFGKKGQAIAKASRRDLAVLHHRHHRRPPEGWPDR